MNDIYSFAANIFLLVLYSRSSQSSSLCLKRCNHNLDRNYPSNTNAETVCGNNGILYKSSCHFSNALCFDAELIAIPTDLCKGKNAD